jgi:chromosome segregation ATPase
VDEISILQRNLNLEKSANSELEQRLKNAKKSLQDLEQEFNEFKLKANKTLQDKDELIRALKNSDSTSDSDEVRRVLQSQCDAMVLEIQDLREKSDLLKKSLDRVQNEDVLQLKTQIDSLNEQLESEHKIKTDLEIELKQIRDESRYFQEDLLQTKNSLESRIADRDSEIEKLRKQLVSKRNNGNNVEELETRFRNLTENLIQKQTLVEQLSSEKHSLTLQLERSEQRLREAITNPKSGEGLYESNTCFKSCFD